jgi:AcrR family transcriptional regulator
MKPAPISRRERPAKPALTRQGIIDAALEILSEEGIDKVTMRRLAAVLDTGPASLYVYVRNTEDLHAQMLDALLRPVVAAVPAQGSWRERLKALLTSYLDLLSRHPKIARMALSTQPSGSNYLDLVEAVLSLLGEGGVDDQAAAWGLDLLLLYPTAIAVEHSGPKTAGQEAEERSALAKSIAEADPERLRRVLALGEQLTSGDAATRTDWALDVLIDGLIAAASRAPRG